MEHRLVLGGEQFLPFARSRIKALRATGLPYADQSFEIDGVSIKVRIEPGHEYIRLEGGPTPTYMESGQLEWSGTGELNPERLDPAKWHFIGIPTTGKYLGQVVSEFKSAGAQLNTPALSEGMDSLAVGYPQKQAAPGATAEEIAAIAASNAQAKVNYGGATLLKKTMMSMFRPSLFSGKMRLFMQAQYGAAESLESNWSIAVVGAQAVLTYTHPSGASMTVGMWAHSSQGIYVTPDFSYWLIHIRNATGYEYVVTAYPLRLRTPETNLLAVMRKAGTTADERAKCEAYVLSSAVIGLDAPQVIFREGCIPSGTIAYGWKWNTDGSKASIVTTRLVGTDSLDNRFSSAVRHLSFSSHLNTITGKREFTVSSTVGAEMEWQDGWGAFHIFTPSDDKVSLELFSVLTNRPGAMPEFSFPKTPIYGYYKGDTWVEVAVSKHVDSNIYPIVEQSESNNVRYDPSLNMAQSYRVYYGVSRQDEDVSFEVHQLSYGTTMDLNVGDDEYLGKTAHGIHEYTTKQVAPTYSEPSYGGFVPNSVGTTFYTPDLVGPPTSGQFLGSETGTAGFATVTRTSITFTGFYNHAWTLVVPQEDCSAVNVATHTRSTPDSTPVRTVSVGYSVIHFAGSTVDYGTPGSPGYSPAQSFSYSPWGPADTYNTSWGAAQPETAVVDTAPPPVSTAYVFCYSDVLSGLQGIPSGSYEPLFIVDKDYAYFSGGMYTITSHGGRYVLSEGLKSDPSINYLHHFVGWA